MVVRFDVEEMSAGWRVVDRHTGLPAYVDGLIVELLDEAEAGEIADLLNTLDFLKRSPAVH